MYRETAIPRKPTTKIGEKDGKEYVGMGVIISNELLSCSKRSKYQMAGVFTVANHG